MEKKSLQMSTFKLKHPWRYHYIPPQLASGFLFKIVTAQSHEVGSETHAPLIPPVQTGELTSLCGCTWIHLYNWKRSQTLSLCISLLRLPWQIPQTGAVYFMFIFSAQEVGSPRSRCQQVWFLLRPPSSTYRRPSLPRVLAWLPLVFVCVVISYKDQILISQADWSRGHHRTDN